MWLIFFFTTDERNKIFLCTHYSLFVFGKSKPFVFWFPPLWGNCKEIKLLLTCSQKFISLEKRHLVMGRGGSENGISFSLGKRSIILITKPFFQLNSICVTFVMTDCTRFGHTNSFKPALPNWKAAAYAEL